MAAADWPVLDLPGCEGTIEVIHLWTQIVGKVRLALEPMVNHWWQVPLYVSARGLTTSLMHAHGRGVEMEFDFLAHQLEVRTTNGDTAHVPLEPGTVAHFYASTMDALDRLGVPVRIYPYPVEMPAHVAFPDDTEHRPYDADAAQRVWRALVQVARVMTLFRARFVGKVSPVHFFWGAADMAVTRFSGRAAPRHRGGVPNCPDWVQQMAYSHEVSSCGYWPGGSEEGTFYSYAYPEPEGFGRHTVEPDAAHYDETLGEFLLPYAVVRTAADPDATVLRFFQTTYEAAAELAGWDRSALEVGNEPSRGDPSPPTR